MKFIELSKKGQIIFVISVDDDDDTKIKMDTRTKFEKKMKYRTSNVKTCGLEAGLWSTRECRFLWSAIQQRRNRLITSRKVFKLRQYLQNILQRFLIHRQLKQQEEKLPLDFVPYALHPPAQYTSTSSTATTTTDDVNPAVSCVDQTTHYQPTTTTFGLSSPCPIDSCSTANMHTHVKPLQSSTPTTLTSAPSISSSNNSMAANRTPRHKRKSHIRAEVKRRNKIQNGFETLKTLVPAIANSSVTRESKAAMLVKASERCHELKSELEQQQLEAASLREQIRVMTSELEHVQGKLPIAGVKVVDRSNYYLQSMFDNYVQTRANHNWKFWIFSILISSLFETFKISVSTKSSTECIQSVKDWASEHLTLVNLRPIVLSALRQISTRTSIMTEPEKLEMEMSDLVHRTKPNQ